jgi:hypothetical protein
MIRHIVMFKMYDEKKDQAAELKSHLDALPAQIPEIKKLEAGLNLSDSPRAYDVCLCVDLESMDALERYRVHPAHQEVVEYIKTVSAASVVVDYQL